MAIRVKINMKIGNKVIETAAMLNSGFESDRDELIIPRALIEKEKINMEIEETVAGESISGSFVAYRIKGETEIKVIVEDEKTDFIPCSIAVVNYEREVIVSDKLIDALKIELVEPGKGKWRFKNKIYKSVKPIYWE